ncbi:hypothetical protein ABMA71_15915, partial [Halobacteriovorax sp. ZH3_bin.1]|uniref:hypothetical protein n=1 Tax=Halobacteriovorax sp. ZH3_bin.1 TaxID=3157725 RepID=UPI00371D2BF8
YRDVFRFEAVKEKLALVEQYSSLKAKSIQMMCRCVDTIGPIEGNNWIKSDVENDYVKYCNNVGKYLASPSDTLSDRVDVYSSCLQDSGSGCKLTSRYNEFVKEGEVIFPEDTESRIKQIDFNTFLSDLAIEKLDVITKASLIKVGAGGDLLAHMSNFINNANWNYVKYTASKKSVTKKCLLPVCHILDSNILGGFGTKIMAGIINVASLGFVLGSTSNMDIYSTKERVTTVEKCSPLAKEKDWKKWGVKIGKKKTYSCIKYVAVPNDVCGINSPVFLCGRNVYRYDQREGGDGSFQLDPLLPAQEHLYVNNKYRSKERVRYKKKIGKLAEHIFSRENSFFIHDHAIGFFKNSVIYKAMGENSYRDELSSSFAELAMKAMDYKKVWRKKNTPVHKFTLMPGLNLPLAVRSTEDFLASNREKDLNTADAYADYAISMNRFAVKTKTKALQNNDAALMVENMNDSFSNIQNAQSEREKASSS